MKRVPIFDKDDFIAVAGGFGGLCIFISTVYALFRLGNIIIDKWGFDYFALIIFGVGGICITTYFVSDLIAWIREIPIRKKERIRNAHLRKYNKLIYKESKDAYMARYRLFSEVKQ